MKPLHELTASEIVTAIAQGKATAQAVAEDCLAHIAAREPQVKAWNFLDRELVIEQARELDRGGSRGVLHGVPVGLKDIIDTADMPTELGSPIHRGRRPTVDAACTALTRRAGGVIMGKTVTTEFANFFPGKTTHPLDASRTPGGSSSGSAAAVGAGMVPLALGTQTTASTIRPSSFCGCVGYVPSRTDIRTFGVMESSASFDALGLIARSVDDINLYRSVLIGTPFEALDAIDLSGIRIGFARTAVWDQCEPATQTLLEQCARDLAKAQARVEAVEMPADFGNVEAAHRLVSSFEFVRNRAWEIDHHWDDISQVLRNGRIKNGIACTFEQYSQAREDLRRYSQTLDALFAGYDVLLTPAAAGEAPIGLGSTGNPAFSILWTGLNVPALTLPLYRGPNGLPIGVQLIGKRYADQTLLTIARAVEERMR
jgi:Asp-tRNA(Asn)/Glu-tRNA(Gln) amidotransferase A subunit family amidase